MMNYFVKGVLLGLGVISVVAFAATATNWSQLANKTKSEGGDLVTEFFVLRDKVRDLDAVANSQIITGTGQVNLGSSPGVWEVSAFPDTSGTNTIQMSFNGGGSWTNLGSDGFHTYSIIMRVNNTSAQAVGTSSGSTNVQQFRFNHGGINGNILFRIINGGVDRTGFHVVRKLN